MHNILLHVTSFFFKIWMGRFSWNSRAGSVRPFQTHTLRMSKYVIKVVLSCRILEATLPPGIVHNCHLLGAILANYQLSTIATFWRQLCRQELPTIAAFWGQLWLILNCPLLPCIGGQIGQKLVQSCGI